MRRGGLVCFDCMTLPMPARITECHDRIKWFKIKALQAAVVRQSKQPMQPTQPPKQPKPPTQYKPAKESKASSSQATSSVLAARKTTETDEKVKTLGGCRAPMQSFLRPASIVGGGFGRANTGMLPGLVKGCWGRGLQPH